MPRIRTLLAAAGVTAAAVLAAAPGSAQAHDPRPSTAHSGHVVPGLTGDAALRAGADVTEHFREIHQRQAVQPADTLHNDWGVDPNLAPVGMMATQSINPNVHLSTAGNETLYTPTMLASHASCVELSTIYKAGVVEVGAWDWCADTPAFRKLSVADSTFMSTYTTTARHQKAYTARVVQTDPLANTWVAALFNQQTKAWDTFYTSSGQTQLSTPYVGWDSWEIYSNVNSTTGNGYYCADAAGATFESSSLQYSYDGTSWQPATADNSFRKDLGGTYNCPSLVRLISTPNSDFFATVPKAPPAWPTVQSGNSGNRVKTVQYLLNSQNNAGLSVDGAFGSKTVTAVKAFQTAKGLKADGIVGPLTWAALVPTVQPGATGDAVKAIQNELTAHSLSTTVSGSFDTTTSDHVQQFQLNSGVAPAGTVDAPTWQFLVQ
ncbi:MAG: peptidoglycan-binding protein [Mycobacteriales bacterium]